MTEPSQVEINAAHMVSGLQAIKQHNPMFADVLAHAHLHAFLSYHKARFGPTETLRVIDEAADHLIGKALTHGA